MISPTILQDDVDRIKHESKRLQELQIEVGKIIVGQHDAVQSIIMAILCDGHVLLEGVPGVAKTTMIKTITKALGLTFSRIQFTPDLLPADVVGTVIYNAKTHEFETKKGPIFANLVLADEVNRAPAKVQSALLEAMQERQVTIGANTLLLDRPFLVFATQNPIEQEGTYGLPEAQLDRFLFKVNVYYPTIAQEKQILFKNEQKIQVVPILHKEDIVMMQELVKNNIFVDEKILDYITQLVFATRTPEAYNLKKIKPFIQYGVSPRATIALYTAAKAHAFMKERAFVIPDDVKAVAVKILNHRIILTYDAEADNITQGNIVDTILKTIPAP